MDVIRTAGLLLVVLSVGASTASAEQRQTPPQGQPPPTEPKPAPSTPPVAQAPGVSPTGAPAPVAAPGTVVLPPLEGADLRRRRNAIDAMEGMLPTKVRSGAKETMAQIQTVEPGLNLLTTSAEGERGLKWGKDGGVFCVAIPGL
ncbi:hypothetical protein BH18ACI5_BH18ACI5_12180 [soil metagenome]